MAGHHEPASVAVHEEIDYHLQWRLQLQISAVEAAVAKKKKKSTVDAAVEKQNQQWMLLLSFLFFFLIISLLTHKQSKILHRSIFVI